MLLSWRRRVGREERGGKEREGRERGGGKGGGKNGGRGGEGISGEETHKCHLLITSMLLSWEGGGGYQFLLIIQVVIFDCNKPKETSFCLLILD